MPLTFPANPAVNDTTTTGGRLWRWNGQAWTVSGPAFAPLVQCLVVGGGGGGPAGNATFGPGPGGGGGGVVQSELGIVLGTAYAVSIGAGGSGAATTATVGSPSIFGALIAGGGGASRSSQRFENCLATCAGITGNESSTARSSSPVFGSQGFQGGFSVSGQLSGGGGGAGGVGADSATGQCGAGGVGVNSTIPATARFFGAGGGAGSNQISGSTASAGAGGQAGGGAGAGASGAGANGVANTGGGGGGGRAGGNTPRTGGNGGSGIVVLRLPSLIGFTVSAGLTYSNTIVGAERVLSFTAGTGTLTLL